MRSPRKFLPLVAALASSVVALTAASSASAAVTCEYDDAADGLNVRMDADGDLAQLSKLDSGSIRVIGSGVVTCSGGTPTVSNVDTVNVFDMTGTGRTSVDVHRVTDFAPGKTVEPTGQVHSEIEFNFLLGGGTEDRVHLFADDVTPNWRAGTTGVNWNAGGGDPLPDADVTFLSGVDQLNLVGTAGNDLISGQGGAGTGNPYTAGRLRLTGGQGNDVLSGGNAAVGDQLFGSFDDDELNGFAGNDELMGYTGNDRMDGGAGTDLTTYHLDNPPYPGVQVDLGVTSPQNTGVGADSHTSIENLIGSPGPDRLIGDSAANSIQAGDGDDTVGGGPGADNLNGGAGTNTLSYAASQTGVTVNMGAGTATGEGADAFAGFKSLTGSPLADQLTGSAAGDEITPGRGADTVSALAGPDLVQLRDGDPDTATCGTELDTAIGDAPRLDSADPDCEIFSVLFEPSGPGAGDGGAGGDGGAEEPVTDGAAPQFELAGKPRQAVVERGGVVVTASCPLENCTVLAEGAGKLRSATESLASGVPERMELKLKRQQLRKVEAALRDGRRPKLAVTAEATDAAGNGTTDSLTVTAKEKR